MHRVLAIATGLVALWGCGENGGSGSTPGALINNIDWVPTTAGEEFFGPPVDLQCPTEPEGDCPVTDDPCRDFPNGIPAGCIVSSVAECLQDFTVLSVYTRRPDNTPLCNWLTLEQESLRPISEGDEVEIRLFHFALNAPFDGQARIAMSIGDELVMEEIIAIPQPFNFLNRSWIADRDVPAGTRILFHVDNHGANEYGLVEVNICDPRSPGSELPCIQ